jgi:solute carrier family 40 (iron-regulated transporter), member 1
MTQSVSVVGDDASEPLLTAPEDHQPIDERQSSDERPPKLQPVFNRLYISHFLSAWNSRMFEFGSVLFLASIYPDTLLPVSIYALVRAAAAITLSPAVGVWIDTGHRLFVVRVSIIGERIAIATSCAIFLVLNTRQHSSPLLEQGLFLLIVILAGVEKLCSIMNSVSVTRDWVIQTTNLEWASYN